jgi:hypothetical protein
MRFRRFGSAIALTSALVLLSAGAAQALTAKQKRRLCYPRGSITKLVTREARVYQANPAKTLDTELDACLFATGHRRLLDSYDEVYSNVASYKLAGRFVAWDYTSVPSCKNFCPPGVTGTEQINVMDLRSGRTRSVTTRASIIGLTPRGTLVWIGPDPAGQALMAIDARGQRVLDSGDIDPGFLKVFGTLVLWSKAREGRWVDLA